MKLFPLYIFELLDILKLIFKNDKTRSTANVALFARCRVKSCYYYDCLLEWCGFPQRQAF